MGRLNFNNTLFYCLLKYIYEYAFFCSLENINKQKKTKRNKEYLKSISWTANIVNLYIYIYIQIIYLVGIQIEP